MKKLFTLVIVASVMFACSKEDSPVTVSSNDNEEKGAVMFNMSSPDFTVKSAAGLRNAANPSAFTNLKDITAMLFNISGNMTYKSADIKNSITWEGNTGDWTGELLSVPTGKQSSIVVFNTGGMYEAALGAGFSGIRFHLVGNSVAASVAPATDGNTINEVAVSESIASQDITNKGTFTFNASVVSRINSKVQVNMGYNRATMFNGNAQANFRVKSVTLSNVPENVDYQGLNPNGAVTIAATGLTTTLADDNTSGAETAKPVNKDNATNVMSTLTFPFVVSTVTLDVLAEYTIDGGVNWKDVTLKTIPVNAVGRNQIINVNIFLKDLVGAVDYDFTFTDWDGTTIEQAVDGEEA